MNKWNEVDFEEYPEIAKVIFENMRKEGLMVEESYKGGTMYYNSSGYTRFNYNHPYIWSFKDMLITKRVFGDINKDLISNGLKLEISHYQDSDSDEDRTWKPSLSFKLLENSRIRKIEKLKQIINK